jgi:hypothetical protein
MDLTQLTSRLRARAGADTNAIFTCGSDAVVRRTDADLAADVMAAAAALRAWGIKAGMRVGIRAAGTPSIRRKAAAGWLSVSRSAVETTV